MKKLNSVFAFLLIAFTFFAQNSFAVEKKTQVTISKGAKVEVYYFHYTRRCVTCQAIEDETQKAIAELYPAEQKEAKIRFQSVNLDTKGTEGLVQKCKAEGQSLLVICGNKRVDLTEQAFMYAKSSPAKLKAELKKVIDRLL
jgi:hypothetical protein